VNGTRQVLWSFEFPLDESFVDRHLGADIGEFAPLPGFHLLPHGFKVPLHPIDTHRDAVDQRERL
jgi:hypothetical protein